MAAPLNISFLRASLFSQLPVGSADLREGEMEGRECREGWNAGKDGMQGTPGLRGLARMVLTNPALSLTPLPSGK